MQGIGCLNLRSFDDSPSVKPASQVIEVCMCRHYYYSQSAYVAAFLYDRNQVTKTGQKNRPSFLRGVSVAPPARTGEHRMFDYTACT